MKKFCSNCGKVIDENETVCSKCGNQLSKVSNTVIKDNKKNDASKLGFIFSIIGVMTCGLTSIIGLILCIIGLSESKKKGDKDTLGLIGLIISSIITGLWVIAIAFTMITAETIKVEDFSTMSKEEAQKVCEEKSLNCEFIEEYSDTITEGDFIRQGIEAGQEIKSYSTIEIVYSKGPKIDDSIESDNNNGTDAKSNSQLTEEEKKNDYKVLCTIYNYKDIARQPDQFKGKKAIFRGKVIQVSEGIINSKKVELRVNVTQDEYGFWDDTVYVTYTYKDGEPKILEDDIIDMYGTIEGTTTYISVLGAKITIPSFKAKYIDIVQ